MILLQGLFFGVAVAFFIFGMPYFGLLFVTIGLILVFSSMEISMFSLPTICFAVGIAIFWQPGFWYYSFIAFGAGVFFLIPMVISIVMGIREYLRYIKAGEIGGGEYERHCSGCNVLYLVDANRMAYDKWFCQNCARKMGL